ncbi:uroporphyrinogen decarboxylase family protein [Cellulosilyticum sp. I15G10I2]|uniref:uroporphyrinogen decarboxylase family protein n=1 Tax=Cellulosilyticum sp. I15G10I2 TaxID=1892843 RepID=UPI00085C24FC|nr:uroporphyrinogen decarboxylase family protein [Cellulosilyticum sp. I15G10I2]
MNAKKLVLDAIRNEQTERAPWVPFVGCHAASLIGVNAEEYFKSSEHIFNGVTKAYEDYRPDGLPVLFDLQVEAEALGCGLKYAENNPPSVATHPLVDGVKLEDLKVPTEKDGRFPIVMEATKRICEALGDKIALYGLITGPYTLALHLRGTEIFFDMMDDPDYMHSVMAFCEKVCIATAQMYMDAGVDIVAIVDPMTSQISPDSFAEFVAPYATSVFEAIRAQGKLSSFFVCGDAKKNVEEMCKCKPNNISIDENIPLDYVKEVAGKYGVSFGGNVKLTLSLLFGTVTDCIKDAQNCMAVGGTKGYILAPGCDMPFSTPVDNIKAISSLVHGEIAEFLEDVNVLDGVDAALPDYPSLDHVRIDVITLDSESCAPCQYMMEAVRKASEGFEGKVVYKEHKVKDKEAVITMVKLGVSNIPTICIDGQIKHVSIIPSKEELVAQLKEIVEAKGV